MDKKTYVFQRVVYDSRVGEAWTGATRRSWTKKKPLSLRFINPTSVTQLNVLTPFKGDTIIYQGNCKECHIDINPVDPVGLYNYSNSSHFTTPWDPNYGLTGREFARTDEMLAKRHLDEIVPVDEFKPGDTILGGAGGYLKDNLVVLYKNQSVKGFEQGLFESIENFPFVSGQYTDELELVSPIGTNIDYGSLVPYTGNKWIVIKRNALPPVRKTKFPCNYSVVKYGSLEDCKSYVNSKDEDVQIKYVIYPYSHDRIPVIVEDQDTEKTNPNRYKITREYKPCGSQKGFYKKAWVHLEDGVAQLQSYSTQVASIAKSKGLITWTGYTVTTSVHIRDFAYRYRCEFDSKFGERGGSYEITHWGDD